MTNPETFANRGIEFHPAQRQLVEPVMSAAMVRYVFHWRLWRAAAPRFLDFFKFFDGDRDVFQLRRGSIIMLVQ